MSSAQLNERDPRARLVAYLQELEEARQIALQRQRVSNGERYNDPDAVAALKCTLERRKLIEEYHAQALTSVADIEARSRPAAIAELEAVLAVWREVSDEAWLAARLPQASAVAATQRNGVVRRRKAPAPTGGH
jgi:hypothetical protein